MRAVAAHPCGVGLMHMRGDPATMQQRRPYDDVVAEVGVLRPAWLAAARWASPREASCGSLASASARRDSRTCADAAPLPSWRWPFRAGGGWSRKSTLAWSPAGRWRSAWPPAWRGDALRVRARDRAGARCRGDTGRTQNLAAAGRRPAGRLIAEGKYDEQEKYFGTDGIRGTVGRHRSRRLRPAAGHAVGACCAAQRGAPHGADRQGHAHLGYMLESALEAGFASAGVDVLMTWGRCPRRAWPT